MITLLMVFNVDFIYLKREGFLSDPILCKKDTIIKQDISFFFP